MGHTWRFPGARAIPLLLIITFSACASDSEGSGSAESEATEVLPLPEGAQARSLIGRALYPQVATGEAGERLRANLAAAQEDLELAPEDADALIWVGRRHAYLGDYQAAITTFARGIELHPEDARFYRHRGHRYVTVRQLEKAASDFEHATRLIAGTEDEIEPDGQPNELGIPISTLHHNIWYHLGLTRYLQNDLEGALDAYQSCLDVSTNDDGVVSCSYWLYLINRRMGTEAAAEAIAEGIEPEMNIIENHSYHRLLLLFGGELSEEDLLASRDLRTSSAAAIEYGVSVWRRLNGDTDQADDMLTWLLSNTQWASFGFIAAEADLARGLGANR